MSLGRVITGGTRVVGIIADPIAHIRTPQAFNALLQRYNSDAVMIPLHLIAQDLNSVIRQITCIRNLAGIVATVPHKESMVALCGELTPVAKRIGAVNVARVDAQSRKLIGTNTDGEGFMAGLNARGHSVRGRRAYIAGAGGAAKAVAVALLDAGVSALGIHNRSVGRAEELVNRLAREYAQADVHIASDTPTDYSLAVNATSLGLREGDALPFDTGRLHDRTIVADVVMSVDLTPLLQQAQARGLIVHLGRYMLEGQLESMIRFLDLAEPLSPAH